MAKKRKKKTDIGTIIFRLIGMELLILTVVLAVIGVKYVPALLSIVGIGSPAAGNQPVSPNTENLQSGVSAGTENDSRAADGTGAPAEGTGETEARDLVSDQSQPAEGKSQTDTEKAQSDTEKTLADAEKTSADAAENTTESFEGETELASVSLVAVGDNLMHRSNTLSGKRSDGTYSYYDNFCNVKDIFQAADLAVISQDTVMAGTEYGLSAEGVFTTGTEIGDSMVDAGINVVLAANNHILDMGRDGLNNMINYWRGKHPDTLLLGVNQTAEQKMTPVYTEQNGVKIAMINYSCQSNYTSALDQEPYLLNLKDDEWLTEVITAARQEADFVIAFPHWGSQNELDITEDQEQQAQFLSDLGVDLIIGAYPHVVEPVRWVTGEEGNRTLVYYSLGNFQSIQDKKENMLGGLAKVTITKTDKRTYISDCDLDFLVTHYASESTNDYFDIVTTFPLSEYTDELAAQHGILLWDSEFSCESMKILQQDILERCDF